MPDLVEVEISFLRTEENMNRFREKYDKLKRKVEKNGFILPEAILVPEKTRKDKKSDLPIITMKIAHPDYTIKDSSGNPLKILGYVNWKAGEPMVYSFIGEDLLKSINRDSLSRNCDHCTTNRQRNKIFYFQDSSKKILQVGSTCVKLYGGINVARACSIGESLQRDFDRIDDYLVVPDSPFPTSAIRIIGCSIYIHEVEGHHFISKKRAADEDLRPTSARIIDLAMKCWMEKENFELSPERVQMAEEIANWAETKVNSTVHSDYWHNVSSIVKNDYVTMKNVAFLAPLYHLWQKEQAKVTSHISEQSSGWIGHKGEEITAEVEFVSKSSAFQTKFGNRAFFKFRVKSTSQIISLLADPHSHWENYEGFLKGKVKEHSEFRGIKETQIFYAKMLSFDDMPYIAKKSKKSKQTTSPYSTNFKDAIELEKQKQNPKGCCKYLIDLSESLGYKICSNAKSNKSTRDPDCSSCKFFESNLLSED